MAKRFTSTEIWNEDWFLDMPIQYKLFWFYMLTKCDHAGLFKVNIGAFNRLVGLTSNRPQLDPNLTSNTPQIDLNLTPKTALEHLNSGKQRVRVISESVWLIEDFFVYQYGTVLNFNNRLHESIALLYKKNDLNLTSIRGLLEVKDTLKDKDKDIKKGGVGENKTNGRVIDKTIFGKEFTEDQENVILSNGETQPLGASQKFQLKHKSIKPKEIYKGYIV